MSPLVSALSFVGLWLLVGLGIILIAVSTRALRPVWVMFRLSRAPVAVVEGSSLRRATWGAVLFVGLAFLLGGLGLVAASFVH